MEERTRLFSHFLDGFKERLADSEVAVFVEGALQLPLSSVVHESAAEIAKEGDASKKEAHLHLEEGSLDHGLVGGFGESFCHFDGFFDPRKGGPEADNGGEREENSAAP